ncbi:hypothetical protein A6R68_02417, partial [Neotoma lepida]
MTPSWSSQDCQIRFLCSSLMTQPDFPPDVREELGAMVKGGLEATSTEVTETKNSPLQQGFLEEELSLIMETFSKEELSFEACIGESWLDSLLGDPESLPRSDMTNKESPTDSKSHESKSSLSPGPLFPTGEDAVMSDIPAKNLTPVIVKESRSDFSYYLEQSQKDSVQGEEKLYKCSECGKSFSQSYHLLQHWIVHLCKIQGWDQEKPPTSNSSDQKKLCESQCGDSPSMLHPQPVKRKNTPTDTKSYRCKTCGKTFSQAFHLAGHQKVHTQKLYECTTCPEIFHCKETFSRKEQLVQHRQVHTIESLYECKQCGEHFICSSTLHCHLNIHTRENTSEKVLGQNSRHIEKCFKCDKCGKAFNHKEYLGQHEKSHTKVTSCECNPCGKTYERSVQLICHRASML